MTPQTSQHTPGPWTVEHRTEIHAGPLFLARLQTGANIRPSEVDANASLMALAPEIPVILEALRDIADELTALLLATASYDARVEAKIANARALLARIEGR